MLDYYSYQLSSMYSLNTIIRGFCLISVYIFTYAWIVSTKSIRQTNHCPYSPHFCYYTSKTVQQRLWFPFLMQST
ncbi:hypothetical protein CROQUDRAFT_478452 [Cronartium quercuum f. sp. fusiforme G11]|uniref:Uncharacterized protein n=1 Tax=Cronartium quercuum f. sp. fusiforme G11 TaxID=708437 RepID=A0A9P6NHR2_9BASI|nr:hypothetical protein CROQUDRAFT_478452 [Cronartium quercuum f. sp. fusiforme G11]